MRTEEITLKRHTDACPGISRSHSKRNTDTCCGIATYIACPLIVPTQEAYWYLPWDCYLQYIARPLIVPTQEAYWYLPWDCYLYNTPTKEATDSCHGIATYIARTLKMHTDTCRRIATYIACPLIVPTQEAFWYLPWTCYLWTSRCHTQEATLCCVEPSLSSLL